MADEQKKTVAEWERETGYIVVSKDPDSNMTESKFMALVEDVEAREKSGAVGVDFTEREKWLKANGHEVTRENMIDRTLSGDVTV